MGYTKIEPILEFLKLHILDWCTPLFVLLMCYIFKILSVMLLPIVEQLCFVLWVCMLLFLWCLDLVNVFFWFWSLATWVFKKQQSQGVD
jgi:hypothetical protein